jgi:hypothetical protein
MNHATARAAVAAILQGSGFGERALAVALAAQLADAHRLPERVRARIAERAAAIDVDEAPAHVGPAAVAPIPADQAHLCAQLAPLCWQNPAQMGLQLASLEALAELWPHAAGEERPHLRARFVNGASARAALPGSVLTGSQLREWQRDLPTGHGDSPNVTALKAVVGESSAQDAYRALAEHLGSRMDIPTLSWVLGALAAQVLCNWRDTGGYALQSFVGTVALERLTRWTPPEHLAVVVAQLAHQLWWTRNRAGLPPIRACLDSPPRPLHDAVLSGDLTAAQRAARNAAKLADSWWEQVWRLLDEWVDQDDRRFMRAVSATAAVVRRTGPNAVSPDDAAALATVFADMAYQDRTTTACT